MTKTPASAADTLAGVLATTAKASGLRGAYPNGIPLTRLTTPYLNTLNGDTACPASYPRPSAMSCDEYPFRSTWEGAFTGLPRAGGRTFPYCQIPQLGAGTGIGGYSSCMIPADQNSAAGGSLGAVYRRERVIDSDPFRVWIVG